MQAHLLGRQLPDHREDVQLLVLVVQGRGVFALFPAGAPAGATTLGVRPEYVSLAAPNAAGAVAGTVKAAQDIGTYWLLTAQVGDGQTVRARLSTEQAIPKVGDAVWLAIVGSHTCYYRNEELIA